MVTMKPFSKFGATVWVESHTKLKPKLPHILNFANILEGEMKRQTKMAGSTEH